MTVAAWCVWDCIAAKVFAVSSTTAKCRQQHSNRVTSVAERAVVRGHSRRLKSKWYGRGRSSVQCSAATGGRFGTLTTARRPSLRATAPSTIPRPPLTSLAYCARTYARRRARAHRAEPTRW